MAAEPAGDGAEKLGAMARVKRMCLRMRAVCVAVVAAVLAVALVVTPSVWAVELDKGDLYGHLRL